MKCNAKDPSACRYHRPDAGTVAQAQLTVARAVRVNMEARFNAGEDVGIAYWNARWEEDQAERIYYATNQGIAEISNEIEKETDPNKRSDLEMKKFAAEYHLAEQERSNAIDARHGGPLIPAVSSEYAVQGGQTGGNDLWPTFTGSKYEPGLTAAKIKTRLNADIKEAQKAGYLPKHVGYSLRSRGNSLEVRITGAHDEQVYEDPDEPQHNRLTDNAKKLRDRLTGMVNAYEYSQYDEVEGRTNFTNFYSNVNFESGWERSLREEKELKKLEAKTNK